MYVYIVFFDKDEMPEYFTKYVVFFLQISYIYI